MTLTLQHYKTILFLTEEGTIIHLWDEAELCMEDHLLKATAEYITKCEDVYQQCSDPEAISDLMFHVQEDIQGFLIWALV